MKRRALQSRTILSYIIAIGCIAGAPSENCRADIWLPAPPKLFASEYGWYGFKVIPPANRELQTVGVLFSLNQDGEENIIWKRELSTTPYYRSFIADKTRQVIGIAMEAKHPLVLYGPNGDVVATHTLTALVPIRDQQDHVGYDLDVHWWAQDATFKVDQEKKQFVITLKWGRSITMDLETGKLR